MTDALIRGKLWRPVVAILGVIVSLFPFLSCGSGTQSQNRLPPPGFTLTSSPNTVILQQTGSASVTVTIVPTGGFSGSVNLSASGLPSGVTATFDPATATSTSAMDLTVSGSAPTGNAALTITGSSSTITTTTQLNLTVLVVAQPGSLPQSFFALNNVDPTDNPSGDGMLYGAVGHPIRLAWPYIERTRGNFDFSFYDQYAAIAPREGPNGIVAVMDLTLGMTPGWAKQDQSTCRQLPDPNGPTIVGCQAPPDNLQDWKDFITALAHHYNGSNPAQPYIKYYEIWNEWNVNDPQNGFWIGPIPELVTLQTTACEIIHATPGPTYSLVLTPSTVGAAHNFNDQAAQQLYNYLTMYGGANCPGGPNNLIDGVSFHGNLGLASLDPYPQPGEGCNGAGCNGSIEQIANAYRQVANLSGLQTTPLLDTEGGFEAANITDADQRAAWLAQFYILQASLFNSNQLQWVSWFTWGAPGVAGNIETANKTPDTAGVAYTQVFSWLFGRFPAACSPNASVWTCGLTGSGGYQAAITWDDSQTCNNGTCTTSPQTAPAFAVRMRDLAGNSTQITGGSQIQVGLKPIILESQ